VGKKVEIVRLEDKAHESRRSKSRERKGKESRRAERSKEKKVKIYHENIIK